MGPSQSAIARLESGQQKPKFEQLALNDILDDVLHDANFEAAATGATISVTTRSGHVYTYKVVSVQTLPKPQLPTSIFTRTVRGLFGGSVKRDVPLVVSYSHSALRGLTAQVRAGVNRAPRDASVVPRRVAPGGRPGPRRR